MCAALQGCLRRGSQPRLLSPARIHTWQLLPEQVSGGSTQGPLPGDTPALWPQPKSKTLEKRWLALPRATGDPFNHPRTESGPRLLGGNRVEVQGSGSMVAHPTA